ncbi:Membrane protein involved in the export of O-antigen and teichoic acid [Salegentibacter agarivorans]|uniref:Membrane protein involved in the export of O-antigen and teichoic acid n=1 Tax=Salegentibacter agarivorans TaxID=345907 RepID=A0A1I2LDW8_9FLAO|nr:lipopolysaccharide biosynthesis protein [Salegentibacter agarivorans]SFF77213.1 Membrane protein involved in the export of O-antigen and teichoic acid [Salegentibacter agarivorans]
MTKAFKRDIVNGFFWSFFGQFGYMFIGLVANIILARLLSPYEFGQVGIIMFFIVTAKVLTESGLSGALIRKNDATERDYSTVFIFNLGVSIALMMLLIGFSGVIADFYDDQELKNILIVTSSVILINAFQIIQNAKLVKHLKFKKKASYEFVAIFTASTIGVVLAFYNWGVWAIVIMHIVTAFLLTVLLWVFEGPVSKIIFSKTSFLNLYKFGVNTTLASLINSVFDNIYQLILGKYFAISQTGFYYQGKKIQEVPIKIIKSTTLGVVFSSLSKLQDDSKQFNKYYLRIVKLFTITVGLICLLIYFYAQNITLLLYGEKWLGAVFYIQILIVSSFFYMQEMFNRVIFKVFDRTEKILYLEIIKKSIQSVSIFVGVFSKSIEILLYGFLVTSIISFFINYYESRKVQNNFSWHEIILVVKVALIGIGTALIGSFLNRSFEFENHESFYLIPVLLFIFIFSIRIFQVSKLEKDVIAVFKTIKK